MSDQIYSDICAIAALSGITSAEVDAIAEREGLGFRPTKPNGLDWELTLEVNSFGRLMRAITQEAEQRHLVVIQDTFAVDIATPAHDPVKERERLAREEFYGNFQDKVVQPNPTIGEAAKW